MSGFPNIMIIIIDMSQYNPIDIYNINKYYHYYYKDDMNIYPI